jgi:hypothetical protein
MIPTLLLALLNTRSALGAPASPEFHYRTEDGKTLNRPTASRPVIFNGVAIGTTELNKTAESGAIHLLEDGHHFFHKGWYLSDSAAGTPVWQYLPDRQNSTSDSQLKRGRPEGILTGSYIESPGSQIVEIQLPFDEYDAYYYPISLAEEISWSTDWSGSFALDLFDNGSFVASSTSLIGDLADIFFNALEFFA